MGFPREAGDGGVNGWNRWVCIRRSWKEGKDRMQGADRLREVRNILYSFENRSYSEMLLRHEMNKNI